MCLPGKVLALFRVVFEGKLENILLAEVLLLPYLVIVNGSRSTN
jgi:hypothetical protein